MQHQDIAVCRLERHTLLLVVQGGKGMKLPVLMAHERYTLKIKSAILDIQFGTGEVVSFSHGTLSDTLDG